MTSQCRTSTANVCKVQDPAYNLETSPPEDVVQNINSANSTQDDTQSHVPWFKLLKTLHMACS